MEIICETHRISIMTYFFIILGSDLFSIRYIKNNTDLSCKNSVV